MNNVLQFEQPNAHPQLPVQVMLEMFDQPIHFHPWCARLTGSALAGLLLSLSIRKAQALIDPDGWGMNAQAAVDPQNAWFELAVNDVTSATGMSRHEQQAAKRALMSLGLLESRKQGLPAVTRYRLNMPRLMSELDMSLSRHA